MVGTDPAEPGPPPQATAGAAIRAALDAGVRRVLGAAAEARRGAVEGVHQMRVGTRRLRSDLLTFAPLLDRDWEDSLREELSWLADRLGAVRDLDVLRLRLTEAAGADTETLALLFDAIAARHAQARSRLVDALDSVRFGDLHGRLIAASRAPALQAADLQTCAEALPPLVQAARKRLVRAGRRLDAERDPAADLHAVRIRAKRVRYAAEAVAPLLDPERGGPARDFAAAAAAVQDCLGLFHDAVAAAAAVRAIAARGPIHAPFLRAAERLAGRQDDDAQAFRCQFRAVWRAFDRKALRRWLTA